MSGVPRAPRRVGTARAVATVARTELLRVVRDRLGLFFIVVLPVLVIVVIGSASGTSTGPSSVGVVDLDGSTASEEIVAELEATPGLEVKVVSDRATLEADVRLDRVRAGIVVPDGHGARLDAGEPSEVLAVVDPTRASSTAASAAVTAAIDRHSAQLAATTFAVERTGVDAGEARQLARRAGDALAPVPVVETEVGDGGLDAGSPYRYPAAANLVLFTFLNTLAVASVLVEGRRLGITRRVLAGPVSPTTVVAGYAASRLAIAVAQGLLVVLAGAVLFGVRWGDPLAVAALVLAFSIVAAAVGTLVGAVARTPEQTQSVGIPLGIALGMLGGALWPLEIVPDWLRQIGHLTPHAWAMDGWITVIFDGGGIGDIAVELAVLLALGVATTVLGARALRRAVTAP